MLREHAARAAATHSAMLLMMICGMVRVRGEMMGFIESPCLGKRMHSDSICAAYGCGGR
jgi:hypothetical protein